MNAKFGRRKEENVQREDASNEGSETPINDSNVAFGLALYVINLFAMKLFSFLFLFISIFHEGSPSGTI